MRPPQEKLYPEDMRARFAAGTLAAVDAVRGEMERTEWVRRAVAEKLERAKAPPSVPEISDSSVRPSTLASKPLTFPDRLRRSGVLDMIASLPAPE